MNRASTCALIAFLVCACNPTAGPQGGSQTNWLSRCETSSECGGLECLCGLCTATCEADADCDDLGGASCVSVNDAGAVALCGGEAAPSSLCLPRCEESSCAQGQSCVAGVCAADGETTASVSVDPTLRHQTLDGFGTSFGSAEDAVAAHPRKVALYDAVFDAGLDALRFSDRFEGSLEPLRSAADIVGGLSERLGRAPLVFMTSASPPAALKVSGTRTCAGDLATCTLVSLPEGDFDYAALSNHWRASLVAYAGLGVEPAFISVQNNPNWIPPPDGAMEACRFLPQEGTETVMLAGVETEVRYPGYAEAVAAVRAAIADLPSAPKVAAPEATGIGSVDDFLAPLAASTFDSVAIHLYGEQAATMDEARLASIRSLAQQAGRPVHQTEMRADGFDTALFVQHALTHAGASAYLQNDLATTSTELADVALFLLTGDDFEVRLPYHVLAHFAKRTDPGWIRIEASSNVSDVLVTAFLAPDESALTSILINAGGASQRVVVGSSALRSEFVHTEVTRTVFTGVERSSVLGELSPAGIVELPAGSIATVALLR